MKTLLKRFVLDRKRHALRQQLEHVYQERVNGQLLEKHLVARIGRIDQQLLDLSINARR
jgi:hypothetical protein